MAYDKENRKAYIAKNRERIREYTRQYTAENRERRREARREYMKEYDANRSAKKADTMKERYRCDTGFRVAKNLRNRFYMAVKNAAKKGSAVEDLGCTINELIARFAFLYPQYGWETYGAEWEIDHIRPLSTFDLSDPKQVKIACNFNNLQPLPSSVNRSKGARYE